MKAESSLESPDQKAAEPVPLAAIPRLLLNPREAAAALGISPRLLWSLTKDGTIPSVRLGRAVRYSPTSLQDWIALQK